MNRSETPSEHEPEWWSLIDKRAALREQFPSLAKVRSERPGCATDIERKRVFREAAELRKAAQAQARWDAAIAENARRAQLIRNREYKAYRTRQNEMKETA